jgi:hypothetical protein
MFIHLTRHTHAVLGGSALMATLLTASLVQNVHGRKIEPSPIAQSASVFIDPMGGFGPMLQEAFLKNGVPLVIVRNKGSADFEITGEIRNATEPTAQIRVSIVDLKTMSMAWGYGMTGFHDLPTAAESCAKSLKHEMKHGH